MRIFFASFFRQQALIIFAVANLAIFFGMPKKNIKKIKNLFYHHIKCNDDGFFFALIIGLDSIWDVLNTFGRIGIWRKRDGDSLLAIVFISMEDNDIALFCFAYVHNSKVEFVDGKSQVVVDMDGELSQQRLFTGDACTNQRHPDALTLFSILDGAGFLKLSAFSLWIETQGDSGAIAW